MVFSSKKHMIRNVAIILLVIVMSAINKGYKHIRIQNIIIVLVIILIIMIVTYNTYKIAISEQQVIIHYLMKKKKIIYISKIVKLEIEKTFAPPYHHISLFDIYRWKNL